MMMIFALLFPFVVFFVLNRPIAGLVALFLQAILIGWPIATIWALVAHTKAEKAKKAAARQQATEKKT